VKCASAISPAGAAVWCSEAYPGRITDTAIIRVSGFLDQMRRDEEAAADRGFEEVAHLLAAQGSKLTYPPKRFRGQKMLTADEAEETSQQANLRIHIERAYANATKFNYVAGEICLDSVDMIGKIFRVVFLCANNFHRPLQNAA
jgi:hypothetical protein